jgi:hypothetical protein
MRMQRITNQLKGRELGRRSLPHHLRGRGSYHPLNEEENVEIWKQKAWWIWAKLHL